MNRRSFTIGSTFAGIAAVLGIKGTKAHSPESVHEVSRDYYGHFRESFTDQDGNYFSAEALAHTRDSLDYMFKVYPKGMRHSLGGDTSKFSRAEVPVYATRPYSAQF